MMIHCPDCGTPIVIPRQHIEAEHVDGQNRCSNCGAIWRVAAIQLQPPQYTGEALKARLNKAQQDKKPEGQQEG